MTAVINAGSVPGDVPAQAAQLAAAETGLSTSRNLKIGFFHLGSGMADILATGIWNRIMISDLGFSATPISILAALRYFLAPLGIWAGRQSDQRAIGGYRRLFWIWLGRAMMVISVLGLGFSTASVAQSGVRGEASIAQWLGLAGSMILFSLGNALSGSTFLALIYDRAREDQRGRAVGIVWTFLLIGFTVGGIFFGIFLPSGSTPMDIASFNPEIVAQHFGHGLLRFSPLVVLNLFGIAALTLGSLWFFSLIGEERRSQGAVTGAAGGEHQPSLMGDLRLAWSNPQTRFFFWYLALSMAFAFSQDAILEPFAGDVLGMEARITTRFSGYWGSMAILATIVFLILGRRFKWLNNTRMNWLGVGLLVGAFAIFALSSLAAIRGLVTPGLIVLGLGLGIWNVGTLGMMMDMSPFGRAGTFLGFWTLVVTLARGMGVSSGGIVRDLALSLSGDPRIAYGAVFVIGAVGLAVSLYALAHVNVRRFKQESERAPEAAQVFAAAID
ncbi:MAG: BCD family MFS transporter [bacterium]|nr:BCD family MFS transporter [bacterium]